MEFSQREIIQILRKRMGFNQADLGAKAFKTSPDSGRTKIKNIELGKQVPTYADLKRISSVLGVPLTELVPEQDGGAKTIPLKRETQGVMVHQVVIDRFLGLGECLSILNKAVILGDNELVTYISRKIASTLSDEMSAVANA